MNLWVLADYLLGWAFKGLILYFFVRLVAYGLLG